MKKMILSLVISLQVAPSLASSLAHQEAIKIESFSMMERDYLNPEAVQTGHLSVIPMKIIGFDKASRAKLDLAFRALENVVNSEEFKNRVINFKNTKGQRSFASNNGQSNEEIYAAFMEGNETLQPNTPNEMNFFLNLYYKRFSRVIGYTTPYTNQINVNWKFFRNYAPADVAGNLAHEWIHKIGYDHTSAAEHDSVPYAIGYIVEEMAAKYLTKLGK